MENTSDNAPDRISTVIRREREGHGKVHFGLNGQLLLLYQTFENIYKEIDADHLFTPAHKQRFLDAFDPIRNPDHFVWKNADNAPPVRQQYLLELLHDQVNTYAGTLVDMSNNRYFQEHLDWPVQEGKDIIHRLMENVKAPDRAKAIIESFVSNGTPFTQEHHDAFLRYYSPVYHSHHELWQRAELSVDPAPAVDFIAEHNRVKSLASDLQAMNKKMVTWLSDQALADTAKEYLQGHHGQDLGPRLEGGRRIG